VISETDFIILLVSVTDGYLKLFSGSGYRWLSVGVFRFKKKRFGFLKLYFICRLSDYTVLKDVGIEPKTVATLSLAVKTFLPLG
jgi:hypothetical protein